jgi:hypothetical protein
MHIRTHAHTYTYKRDRVESHHSIRYFARSARCILDCPCWQCVQELGSHAEQAVSKSSHRQTLSQYCDHPRWVESRRAVVAVVRAGSLESSPLALRVPEQPAYSAKALSVHVACRYEVSVCGVTPHALEAGGASKLWVNGNCRCERSAKSPRK